MAQLSTWLEELSSLWWHVPNDPVVLYIWYVCYVLLYDMFQWYDMVCYKIWPVTLKYKWMTYYASMNYDMLWNVMIYCDMSTLDHNMYDMQWNVLREGDLWPTTLRHVLKVMLGMKWNWKRLSCLIYLQWKMLRLRAWMYV